MNLYFSSFMGILAVTIVGIQGHARKNHLDFLAYKSTTERIFCQPLYVLFRNTLNFQIPRLTYWSLTLLTKENMISFGNCVKKRMGKLSARGLK